MVLLHLKKVILFAGLGALGSYLYCKNDKKVFLASARIIIQGQKDEKIQMFPSEVKKILIQGIRQDVKVEQQFLSKLSVFLRALQQTAQKARRPNLVNDINHLYEMYSVIPVKKKDDLERSSLEINVKAYQKEVVSLLIDEIVTAYNESRKASFLSSENEAESYLIKEIHKLECDLQAIEHVYQKLGKPLQVKSSISDSKRVNQLEVLVKQDIQKVNSELVKTKSKIRTLSHKIKDLSVSGESVKIKSSNPIIAMVEAQLMQSKRRKEELQKEALPVEEIDILIENLENNLKHLKKESNVFDEKKPDINTIRKDLEQQLHIAQENQNDLNTQLEILNKQLVLYGDQFPLNSLSGETSTEQDDSEYVLVQAKLNDLKSQRERLKDYNIPSSYIVEVVDPILAQEDSNLSIDRTVFFGGCIGAVIGLIYSIVFYKRVYSAGQLEKITGFPVWATCFLKNKEIILKNLRSLKDKEFKPLEILQFEKQDLYKQQYQGQPIVLLFTSPKNILESMYFALHIAYLHAMEEKKVLVLDLNQVESLTHFTCLEDQRGLSEWVLAGCSEIEDYKYPFIVDQPNLEIIPYGALHSAYITPIEVRQMIKVCQEHADVVIVIGPSCNYNKLVSILAENIDYLYLTVSSKDSIKEIMRASMSVKSHNLSHRGVVLVEEGNV